MTGTSSTKQHRRRLAAAILALPLTLAMTGTAFATGGSDTRGASSAELRTVADKPAEKGAGKPADKSAEKAAAEKPAAEEAAAEKPAAEKPAADTAAVRKNEDAKPDKSGAGSAAGAVSGKSAAAATTTTVNATYVNGNANSSKADRPNAPVAGTPSQPLSNADKNGTGANPGGTCTHNYCSNGTGLEPGNGNDSAPAKGQPCAGCVGKADNKNPKGQFPSGPADHNAGYECDRNQGIGKGNPAHTGCTGTPTTPPTTPPFDACPNMAGNQPAGTPCNPPKDACPNVPGMQSSGPCSGDDDKDVCPSLPGMQKTGPCSTPTTPPTDACPDKPGMQSSGPCKDDDVKDDKITICHATGSEKNPYVVITINKHGLNGHADHERDIIPATNGTCPGGNGGGGTDPEKVTICHATGSEKNPYVVITIDKNGLNGHGGHAGDILPMPAGGCPTVPTTVTDACPNLPGVQMPGTSCTPPPPFDACPNLAGDQPMGTTCTTGGGGGSNPPVDVCPDVPGMQQMGPCATPTGGGGTPVLNPPANGSGTPIAGTPGNQPAAAPAPVVGPPTVVPPTIVAQGTRPPVLVGTVTEPAAAPVAAPRALPFTGTDAALLAELGALLLLVGGGVLVAARRERTARAA